MELGRLLLRATKYRSKREVARSWVKSNLGNNHRYITGDRKMEDKKLSSSASKVQKALLSKGIGQFEVVEFDESTRTADDAAKVIGCSVAQIIKSLVFKKSNPTGDQPVLLLVSGANRVNEKNVGNTIGGKLKRADADYTRKVTGYAIGGIPPLGHDNKLETYIDEELKQYPRLWAAAGTPNAVFPVESKDLQDLTDGKVISMK